jgi:hypothetical protein
MISAHQIRGSGMASSGVTPLNSLCAVPAAPACRLMAANWPGRTHTGRALFGHGAGVSRY